MRPIPRARSLIASVIKKISRPVITAEERGEPRSNYVVDEVPTIKTGFSIIVRFGGAGRYVDARIRQSDPIGREGSKRARPIGQRHFRRTVRGAIGYVGEEVQAGGALRAAGPRQAEREERAEGRRGSRGREERNRGVAKQEKARKGTRRRRWKKGKAGREDPDKLEGR